MATKIVTKNSSTAGAAPTATDLVQGELAVNVADGRLYTEDNAAAIVELGVNPATEITANAGIALPDSQKATFGDGGDLELFYNGTHSVFKDGSAGNIYIQDDNNIVLGSIGGENYLVATKDAAVTLYYDAAAKLATTSTGIDVTGTATMDGLEAGTATFEGSAVNINLLETNTIDVNTRFRLNGGEFIVQTLNDAQSAVTSRLAVDNATGDISFYEDTGTTAKFVWDASAESLGIGTASPASVLDVRGARSDLLRLYSTAAGGDAEIEFLTLNNASSVGKLSKITATQVGAETNGSILAFSTSPTSGNTPVERLRIDSSGNLLVGKTSASSGTIGFEAKPTGFIAATRSNGTVAIFNRTTADGGIVEFRKDGATVGSIGTTSGDLLIGTGDTGLWFSDAGNAILPRNTTGANVDGLVDLGSSGSRFDDIYATNGTIQTSDRNEKQDIAELSDAEQRVAVACKGLLRKFRWKDSVAEKGDEARTHFGIIAQDLQAAFAAEGLDAGDYAMFISTTWTDEETNEEKTRMGVRYSELLAFIIAAI